MLEGSESDSDFYKIGMYLTNNWIDRKRITEPLMTKSAMNMNLTHTTKITNYGTECEEYKHHTNRIRYWH